MSKLSETDRMQKRLAKLLNRKRFARWLRSKRRWMYVGEAGERKRCPLACYLKECGIERPDVGPGVEVTMPNGTRQEFHVPCWAEDFEHELDCCRSNYARDDKDPDPPGWWRLADPDDHVTAREALMALECV